MTATDRFERTIRNEARPVPYTQSLARITRHLRSCNYTPVAQLSISEQLAEPVVRFAWNEIRRIEQVRLLSPSAASALRASLRHRLAWIGDQVIMSELGRAHGRKARARKEPTALIRDFCPGGVAKKTLELLREYSVLARLWAVQVKWWQQFIGEFLGQSEVCIKALKLSTHGRNSIIAIEAGLSDPHDGGRTVMRVRFADESQWYYKPRTGCQEVAWFDLLQWLNDEGFPLPFRIIRVASNDRYCWMEAVRPKVCRTESQRYRLYFRSGALAYLIHLLRGVDFHAANIIVSGDQPVFVDLETLLHPETFLPRAFQTEDSSIVRTGLLGLWRRRAGSHGGFDQLREAEGKSRAGIAGVAQLRDQLIAGFTAMHGFIIEKPRRIGRVRRLVARLATQRARTIYRPTKEYTAMLRQSLAPTFMRNDLGRTLFLLALCTQDAGSAEQVEIEAAALESADIPVFRARRRPIRLDFSAKSFAQSISLLQTQLDARKSHQT